MMHYHFREEGQDNHFSHKTQLAPSPGTSLRVPGMMLLQPSSPGLDDSPRGLARRDHWAVKPPSIVSVCPVTKPAASEHSQTAPAAISSGLPARPTGCMFIIASRETTVRKRSNIGVSTPPG